MIRVFVRRFDSEVSQPLGEFSPADLHRVVDAIDEYGVTEDQEPGAVLGVAASRFAWGDLGGVVFEIVIEPKETAR